MVAPIELSLKVKGDKELKRTKQLIDQVEKAVGKLNKVKITFDTSKAEQSLQRLKAEIKKAEGIAGNFFGDSKIRSGIGAFSAKTGQARKEIQSLRVALEQTDNASERMKFALQTLSGQFKVARLEGQAFAKASAKFFDEGLGSLNVRLREIEKLPKTLFASSEAIKELTFMQSMAVDGTEEFVRVNAALGRQLEINAGLLERAARAQKPFSAGMSMVPPGLQRPALPAAGQTSGSRNLSTLDQAAAAAGVQQATSGNRVGFAAGVESIAMERAAAATQAAAVSSATFAANVKKAALSAGTFPDIFKALEGSFKTIEKFSKTGGGLGGRLRNPLKGVGPKGKSIISSALIGGGFPLLFGGGPGAAIGGGIGGGIGGAIGGAFGFAGGIVGTAIGQALDQAAEGANLFAKEATKASTSIGRLVEAFGLRGTGAAQTFGFAGTLGIGGAARQAAEGSLETIVGKDGLGRLDALAQSSEDAANALDRFGAATTSFFAPLLTAVNQGVAGLFGGISPLEQQRRDQEALENLPTRQRGSAARRNRLTTRIAETSASPEAKAQLELEEKITAVVDARKQLAKDSARVEGIRLTSRRDSFAFEQGTLKVQAEQNKLDVLAIQLAGKLTDQKREELKLEQELAKQAKKEAENARANAVIEARRQIKREQLGVQNRLLGLIGQINGVELDRLKATNGQFAARQEEFNKIDQTLSLEKARLANQLETNLLGKQEGEITVRLRAENEFLVKLAEDRARLEKTLLVQRHAEYDLGRLQVRQALDLQKIQAQTDAQRQIRETSPFERQQFLLDPFFGSSRELAAGQGANFREQVSMMNFQLAQNQAGLDVAGISKERRQALEDQRAQLELNLALFKEYQPAVDEAALAQARFSDALAITKPVTDDLFDSLLSVVEGTKTAEEAFADFLRNIASMLFQAAKSIIAQYLAIGYARLFAFPGSSAGPVAPDVQSGAGFGLGNAITTGMRTAASGKGALMNQPYLVGERGPELFVPKSNGTIVPNHQMGSGASVTVNVDASGSSVEGNADQASQLGKAIGIAVQAELVKQQRPGGLLAR